ncbi:MAG TPA: hypothetical protein VFH60_09865, partial [Chloroflexia bacterium]|nr:hypothetical protein [Chloroflexia bacterium]
MSALALWRVPCGGRWRLIPLTKSNVRVGPRSTSESDWYGLPGKRRQHLSQVARGLILTAR